MQVKIKRINKVRNSILLFWLSSVLISCQSSKKEQLKNIFTDGSCKCWLGINTPSRCLYIFYFDNENHWYSFIKCPQNKEFESSLPPDLVFDNTYFIKNDSVVALNMDTFNFVLVNNHNLIIRNFYGRDLQLLKVPDSLYKYMNHEILKDCIR